MDTEKIIEAYDKIRTTEEIDEEILASLYEARQSGKIRRVIGLFRRSRGVRRLTAAVASVILIVCIFQIPGVKMGAREFLTEVSFKRLWNHGLTSVKMEYEALEVAEDAPKEDIKMDNFQKAGDRLGLKFLASSMEYDPTIKNQVMYEPIIDEKKGKLERIFLTDYSYAWMGKWGEMQIETCKEPHEFGELIYVPEKDVQSPIAAQIEIICNREVFEKYYDQFQDEMIDSSQLEDEEDVWKYHIKSIDTDAEMMTRDMTHLFVPGWGITKELPEQLPLMNAVFTYKGVRYWYYGNVSKEKMEEFLETLYPV